MSGRPAICVLFVLFICTGASPSKRTDDCVLGSHALRQFLTGYQDVWYLAANYVGNATFDYLYEGATGTTFEEFRDDILCDYTDTDLLYTLVRKLDATGHLRILFNLAYKIMTGRTITLHQDTIEELQDPHPWTDVAFQTAASNVVSDLEASGIFSLDPEGFLWLLGVFGEDNEELPDYYPTPDDFSTDSLPVQAARLTNDIRKLWNIVVKDMEPHIPNAGQFLRDRLEHYTGIRLMEGKEAHQHVLMIVGDILGTLREADPLTVLFDLFNYNQVLAHAIKAIYPGVNEGLQMVEAGTEWSLEHPEHPDQAPHETLEYLLEFLQALDRMGLRDLE